MSFFHFLLYMTLYQTAISLRRTLRAGPKGVCLLERVDCKHEALYGVKKLYNLLLPVSLVNNNNNNNSNNNNNYYYWKVYLCF